MNELEDEPEDVQNATSVAEELLQVEQDNQTTRSMAISAKSERTFRCKKDKPVIEEIDCCETKRRRLAKRQKTVTMYVHEEPCKLEKHDIKLRHCMSNKEYIDFLATPSKKCPSSCAMKLVNRRVLPMPPRIDELAKPTTRRMKHTLEDMSAILSPRMIDNLFETIERETALTAEQAEDFVRNCRVAGAKKEKKRKGKCKLPSKAPRPNLEAGEPIDPEIAEQQYAIAKRFVRSILNYQCPIPREQYKDISETILEMLSDVVCYTPVGDEDRKSRQMRLLADCLACWMSSILIAVSEKNKAELEQECLQKRREAEERAALEAMIASEDADDENDDEDACGGDGDDDDDDADCRSYASSENDKACSTMECPNMEDSSTQREMDDLLFGRDESVQTDGANLQRQAGYCSDASECPLSIDCGEDDECQDDECEDDGLSNCRDDEQQTECEARFDAGTDIGADDLCKDKSPEDCEMERIASCVSKAFGTDAPFVTFAKLADTLYAMLECYSENSLCDPLDNRLHRAIYEKLVQVIQLEEPDMMTDRTRDVIDVISGKVARWFRRTLNDNQIKFLEEDAPAKIESREVREWSNWLTELTDQAEVWSCWIERITGEARNMKKEGRITRGAWQDWTSNFESNALRWRETYLKALHQEHWNTMMMADRKVLKTGTKGRACYHERTIKDTNYESPSNC